MILYPNIVGRIRDTDVYIGGGSRQEWVDMGLDCMFRVPWLDQVIKESGYRNMPKFYIGDPDSSGLLKNSERGKMIGFLLANIGKGFSLQELINGARLSKKLTSFQTLSLKRNFEKSECLSITPADESRGRGYRLVKRGELGAYEKILLKRDRDLCIYDSVEDHHVVARLIGDIYVSGPVKRRCESSTNRKSFFKVEKFHVGSPLAKGKQAESDYGKMLLHFLTNPEKAIKLSKLREIASRKNINSALFWLEEDFEESRCYDLFSLGKEGGGRRLLVVNDLSASDRTYLAHVDRQLGLEPTNSGKSILENMVLAG